MPFVVQRFLRALLEIPPDATHFVVRGFHLGDPSTREKLERSASTFVRGYHMALSSSSNVELVDQLEQIDRDLRGFAYEGAGMGLSIVDFFFPWQDRFLAFTQAEGSEHIYVVCWLGMANGTLRSLHPRLWWSSPKKMREHDFFFGFSTIEKDI